MIIKKFQAKTEDEAVELAKKELGSGIVIMNVRQVKNKGLFSFFRTQMTEITVALEEESERYSPVAETNPVKKPAVTRPAAVNSPAANSSIENPAVKQADPKRPVNPQAARADIPRSRDIIFEDEPGPNKSNPGLEEKLDSLQTLLEQQLQKPEEEKPESEEKKEEQSEMYVFLRLLYNKMIDNEINERYANQIIDEVDKNNKPNMPFDYALSNIYQKMILKFGKPQIIEPAANGPKVVFFIGPTGVGKTTTIAKIASRFSVDAHKKVALLTADTYRIAAAEQLKTYANILEIPFRVIYTKEEIEQSINEFRDYDFILVDTAGHSHQNEAQRANMADFIRFVDNDIEKEVFLVLSATTKYRDLISIADTYTEMTNYKLIFTKLDETTTLGNLLNLKLYTGAPLSYMTYGQNVPDDIEDFNPQKTVKQLLGGKV
ncbi:MAG: flagellar biosynthesis protein FlhF [Lachnospiraceae bacterium]|nr:flagellar biosynthesis protein FlhF [Lachnospiraceae bacterium]